MTLTQDFFVYFSVSTLLQMGQTDYNKVTTQLPFKHWAELELHPQILKQRNKQNPDLLSFFSTRVTKILLY